MLMSFTVENYRSFADPVTLNLSATSDENHPAHVVRNAAPGVPNLLRAAAVYGENGAGKSNLVKALAFMQRAVLARLDLYPWYSQQSAHPFRMRSVLYQTPCRFALQFIAEDVSYKYTLHVLHGEVVLEKLIHAPKGRDALLFERTGQDFHFGDQLRDAEPVAGYLNLIATATAPKSTFLNRVREDNGEDKLASIAPVLRWFRALTIREGDTSSTDVHQDELARRIQENPALQEFTTDLLNAGGLRVDALHARTRQHDISSQTGNKEPDFVVVHDLSLIRNDEIGRFVAFSPADESDGTRYLLGLADALYDVTRTGGVLVVDEIGRSVHTLLTQKLIRSITDAPIAGDDGGGAGDASRPAAQIIFTTHDTNLLDLDLLRRDEIWFVEKHENATRLYGLSEFGVRADAPIEKRYLNGRFGAVPPEGDLPGISQTSGVSTSTTGVPQTPDAAKNPA